MGIFESLSPESREFIVELYSDSVPLQKIARIAHYNTETVYRVLKYADAITEEDERAVREIMGIIKGDK